MPKKPGPSPQNADVIDLHGNPGHHSEAELERRRESTPRPRALTTNPPADLTRLELECWKLHAPELDALGMLSLLDRGSFRIACQSYAFAVSAFEEMRPIDETEGARSRLNIIVDDPAHGGGPRRHPAFIIWKQAAGEYRAWCTEFGLTPSSRIGIRPAAAAGGSDGADGDEGDAALFGA